LLFTRKEVRAVKDNKMIKIQYLVISKLLESGSIQLLLPDGLTLDIGIVQEDKFGNLKKSDNYCYIVASRQGKTAMLDSYNLGLQYEDEENIMLFQSESIDNKGKIVKILEVV
jgi:hypothetical protein